MKNVPHIASHHGDLAEIISKIANAKKNAGGAKRAAKVAKAHFKKARKIYREAKRASKVAKRHLKELNKLLLAAKAARVRAKAAMKKAKTKTVRKKNADNPSPHVVPTLSPVTAPTSASADESNGNIRV